jgi:hypothetical protein
MKYPRKFLISRIEGMSLEELTATKISFDIWVKQATATLHAKAARETKRTRVVDTRRKALLGSFVLFRITSSTDNREIATARTWLRRQLPAFLTRTIDQVLLADLIGDGAVPAQADTQATAKSAASRDTRRKILVGALVLHRLEASDAEERAWLTTWIRAELPPFLTRKTDQALLANLIATPAQPNDTPATAPQA